MMHPSAPTAARRGAIRTLALLAISPLALAACFTGERPSFGETVSAEGATGNTAIDAVLDRLDGVAASEFTADYSILTKLGNVSSEATVVQAPPERRSITINDVRFLYDGASVATCNLLTAECEATINDARVSDVSLTNEFYAVSMAQRLRVDASRRTGEPSGYEITQADRPALCVDVPVTGGTKSYCALANGALARYDGSDLFIEMTTVADAVDESKFETG